MKPAFIWAAVSFFLFFVGMSLYLNLRRPTHWYAECSVKDSPGEVEESGFTTEQLARQFAARYEKIGHTCTVMIVRVTF